MTSNSTFQECALFWSSARIRSIWMVVVDREVFPHILELEVRVFVPALHTADMSAVVLELDSLTIEVVETEQRLNAGQQSAGKQLNGTLSAVPDASGDRIQDNIGEPNLRSGDLLMSRNSSSAAPRPHE
ncbi:hypothetical protein B0H17DRAFT_1126336 [Mycena rosella]|uniref:Uncharacterized protein n=1 Tax=Mycena rosella TaxID=1033263 RepID=A0AAD7M8E5_MYCRO|nr:hypothetical protein B0H17DRAFT_1126336 [Mycena rosella]